jgi:hypothetical protein
MYMTRILVQGGTPPYAFSIISGTLPTGLSLNAATGAITGVPTGALGPYTFTVRVTDTGPPQQSAVRSFTISVL